MTNLPRLAALCLPLVLAIPSAHAAQEPEESLQPNPLLVDPVLANPIPTALVPLDPELPVAVRAMIETAWTLNPTIEIVLRTDSADEARLFRHERVGRVFFADDELARSMSRHVLERYARQETEPEAAGEGATA